MFIFTTLHLSLLTAYDQCASEAEKEKLLSSIRYGKLKRFVEHIVNKISILILFLWTDWKRFKLNLKHCEIRSLYFIQFTKASRLHLSIWHNLNMNII